MQPRLSRQYETGMTLFEVGVVIAIMVILAALLLPAIIPGRQKPAYGIYCINNLKQVGLAYRIWEGDNSDVYPIGISLTNGGSMEMAQTGNVMQTFQVMSNELSTPVILICPEDKARIRAANFTELANSNISYFVGVDATNEANPRAFLSGDCNFEINGNSVKPGLLSYGAGTSISWDRTRHKSSGNLGFADGSVQSASTAELRNHLKQTGLATNRFAIP